MSSNSLLIGILSLTLWGCCPTTPDFNPTITTVSQQRNIDCLPTAFPRLSPSEMKDDWGKELHIGQIFAREFDLYRAITSFKRALALVPRNNSERLLQIQYNIVESYYHGQKFQQAIDEFEKGDLAYASPDFPVFGQLLIILYDSYRQLGLEEKSRRIQELINKGNEEIGEKLRLFVAITDADFCEIQQNPATLDFLADYELEKKSVYKAQMLNAVLPGAGYYYVGQTNSAVTSFLINALFTAAAYQFYNRGYIAAGVITTSLELGWYLGGINGAGIEANEYNMRLYEDKGKAFMMKQGLFPILMFETSF